MKLLPHPFLFSLLSQYQHRGRRYFSIDSSASSLASDSSNHNHNHNLGSTTVAVVGSGAVGGYYGARLHEAGYNVKFFMRGGHYETCCKKGLYVHSVEGDIQISRDELQVFASTDEIGTVDWILLSIKSSSLDVVPQLLEPLLGEDTRVIAIMNGLVDDDLVDMLEKYPHSAIYGGMAFICSTRIEAGIIDHSFYGSLNGGLAPVSNDDLLHEDPFKSLSILDDLWEPTKVEFTSVPSLARGRWQKNCWNLPFSGISCAMGGISIDKLVSDDGLRKLADKVMDETISIANADLISRNVDNAILLGDAEKEKMWFLSDNMGVYMPSTSLDFLAKKPMEVRYLFRKPLDKAKDLGVSAPFLETLVTQIEAMQRMHFLF